MNNAAASYFKEGFGLSTESAAAIASIFGWMNLFARGLGGFASNKFNSWMGMRGQTECSRPIDLSPTSVLTLSWQCSYLNHLIHPKV